MKQPHRFEPGTRVGVRFRFANGRVFEWNYGTVLHCFDRALTYRIRFDSHLLDERNIDQGDAFLEEEAKAMEAEWRLVRDEPPKLGEFDCITT